MTYELEFSEKAWREWKKLDSALQISSKESSLHVWSTLTFLPIDFEGWETLTKSSFAVLGTGWSIA
jgi:mRNA-degrading endonuclease RelE of RelBE toxin-antitoxin system